MSHRYSKFIDLISIVGDVLLLNAVFVLAYFLKFQDVAALWTPPYLGLFIYYNGAWLLLTALLRPHRISRVMPVPKIIRIQLWTIFTHLLFVFGYFVISKGYLFSREQLLISFALFTVSLVTWRLGFNYLLRIYRRAGGNHRKVIAVGYGELSEELHRRIQEHPEYGYQFMGFFDEKGSGGLIRGSFSDIEDYVKGNEIDEIYCCLPYVEYTLIQRLIGFAENNFVKVKLITDFRGFSPKSVELENYDGMPVLNVTNMPLDDWKNSIVKRIFDIAFSSVVLITILSWLVPLIALIIKLDSPGPVFFRQNRMGKNGKDFSVLKFRTMTVNKQADTQQVSKNDKRITRVGSFLRKSSLDEVPQFFNVLMGSMSVVGPRPQMPAHTIEYSKRIEKFMVRHLVKPGITGLAQAKGFRGEIKEDFSMKGRIRLDNFYVTNWTLLLDVKIIVLTVVMMIRGDENAY